MTPVTGVAEEAAMSDLPFEEPVAPKPVVDDEDGALPEAHGDYVDGPQDEESADV